MSAAGQRTNKLSALLSEISSKDVFYWLGTTALTAALSFALIPFAASNDCQSWFEDHHSALITLVGQRDSGCTASKNAAECTTRANLALDELRKQRNAGSFALSEGACSAVQAYRETF